MRLALTFMASGHSKRFGGDKLLTLIGGVPLAERCFRAVPGGVFDAVAVVTRSGTVAELAEKYGFAVVMNPDTTDDTSVTIRLCLEFAGNAAGCAFAVCDQPYLTPDSYRALAETFAAKPDCIAALSWNGARGNPVIFPTALFGELRSLPPGGTGGQVIDRHRALLRLAEVGDGRELRDIDRIEDIM